MKVPLLKARVDAEDQKVQSMIGHVTDLQDEYGVMEAEVTEAARVASEAAGQVCNIFSIYRMPWLTFMWIS